MDALTAAAAAIDAANAEDPSRHDGQPLALVQGRLADEWVVRLQPDASAALRLAARAHHLRRWVLPRSSYPDGRAGYLTWRREQRSRHATELIAILETNGAAPEVVTRAATIVTKRGLGHDPEVQVFEDAVSLTFVSTQLASTAAKLADDDKMVDVVAKTLAKMSDRGRAAVLTIEVGARCAALLARAIGVFESRRTTAKQG